MDQGRAELVGSRQSEVNVGRFVPGDRNRGLSGIITGAGVISSRSRTRIRIGLLFALCFALIASAAGRTASAGATTYLPLGHRAYDFLEIMEHRCPTLKAHLGTKPATRDAIARLLSNLRGEQIDMTSAERGELDCLLAEFAPDLGEGKGLFFNDDGPIERLPRFLKECLYRNRRNLYSARGDDYSLYIDPVIVRKAKLGKVPGASKNDNVYTAGNGFILRGTVGDHVGFHVDVRDSKEWGSRDYPENTSTTMPGRGYAAFKGDRAEFDETYAHVAYSNGPFVVSYGRDRNVWGRGQRGTLLMSDYGAPYDMLRVETSFRNIRFMFFAAEIEQYPPISKFYYNTFSAGTPADSVTVKKRIVGHRIELQLGDRLNVGLHETVVYGGRWDWAYLNPVMFLKGAEHANGDHDNAAMGLDFRLFLTRALSMYGEFLIDDITTTKLGTDWYGNKLAYQLGAFFVRPFNIVDTDVRLEYTRLSPWVYTHRYPIDSYTHYGDVLGHPLGPNSDEIFAEIRKRFSRRLHTGVSFAARRHGANPVGENVGGDPLVGYSKGDSKEAKFLSGDLEKFTAVGFYMSFEPAWQLFVKIGYSYERYDGEGGDVIRMSVGLNE